MCNKHGKARFIMGIANVDFERRNYFDNMGVAVTGASGVDKVLELAGLNYEVEKKPIFFEDKVGISILNGPVETQSLYTPVPNSFATVRTDTKAPLGIVGKNYEILQNREAFDFLDNLLLEGAKFCQASSYGKDGSKSFITMSTDPIKVLDDDIMPYILFMNSFDGSGSIKAMLTPIRVFCSNALARAMKQAINRISIRHSRSMQEKLKVAHEILLANTKYLEEMKKSAEKLAVTSFTENQFYDFAKNTLYPLPDGENTELVVVRNQAQIEHLMQAYKQNDLDNFKDSAWRAIQAVADAESHALTFRKTKTIDQTNFNTVVMGMPLMNLVWDRMEALAR